MTDVEQLLRAALDEQAAEAHRADADLFPRALAAQRARRHRVAGVLGSMAVIGGVVGGIVGLGMSGPGGSTAASTADAGGTGVEAQRTQLAAELGIADPPDVQVVRLVVPEERGALVEECLRHLGWVPDTEHGMVEVPADQQAGFDLDTYVCLSSYPIDPGRGGTWTDVQTGIQYDWTVETVLPCLQALGYTVTVPPPTRDEFIADWWTDPYYPVAHVEGIAALSNAQSDLLDAQCPQIAPTDQLWD